MKIFPDKKDTIKHNRIFMEYRFLMDKEYFKVTGIVYQIYNRLINLIINIACKKQAILTFTDTLKIKKFLLFINLW
jgi:hypothetical protein